MALSPKEKARIIEEEQLRFKVRQDLHAQACAQHPRRGRWLWAVALLVLAAALWMHGRCCSYGGFACHNGMGRMVCPMHGGMMPPADGAAPDEAPAQDKAPAAKPQDKK
jgi:hypothetical protein